jgi:aerobic-type carbon monoxide dehydrogenase small subunit (CoxS/CutS family)
MSEQPVYFYVNQKRVNVHASDWDMTLLEHLHERQDLTGTKFGCGIGVCHACTVGVRGSEGTGKNSHAPLSKTLACTTQMSAVGGLHIETVEGLSASKIGRDLQHEFLVQFAFQCGYCTPGFLMSAKAMIENLPCAPLTRREVDALIDVWVGDNLCRCTGYVQYRNAIRNVAMRTQSTSGCRK